MSHRDDYAGSFDPNFRLEHLSRGALARLARETMMAAHVHDRAIMPLVGERYGAKAMTDLANDEWMGASPVFSKRNRRQLGVEGDGVPEIFKGLQFDIGAPHGYLDFNFEVVDRNHGFFWLPYCGAFDDVSKFSGGNPKPVIQLCHHMEDQTFDATVMAVNPRARCRPVHRPPLAEGHRGPTCKWEVRIAYDAGFVAEREITRQVRRSLAAGFDFGPVPEDDDGMTHYRGDFRSDLRLEHLSHAALVRQCKEFALDLNLLIRAAYLSLQESYGAATWRELAVAHRAAAAPVYLERIRRALAIEADDVPSILKTLQVDPAFPRDYARFGCAAAGPTRGWFWLEPCAALDDEAPAGWLALVDDDEASCVMAAAQAVNRRARCRRVDPREVPAPEARLAWEITVDPDAEPLPPHRMEAAVRLSSVASFRFT